MRNVGAHLLEDKMDEAVTQYINSHHPSETVHVNANPLALNVQDVGGGRVNFPSQICRPVGEQVGDGPWNEELLDSDSRIAAIVAQLSQHSRAPHHASHHKATRPDVDAAMLDGPMRLFNGQSLDQQEPIVLHLPHLPPLPPLQEMKRCQEAGWFNNKTKSVPTLKDNTPILAEDENPVLDLNPGASPAHHKQQSKKSLPHKKRISRKLKKNNGSSTPQQGIVVINCSEDVQHEEILPDNFVSAVQHQDQLPEDTHHITHEVRPILLCQLCGEFYGEDQLKFYQHLKHHYEPHATIIIDNPVPDLAIDKMTNTCIVDNVATLPDSIVELSLENTVPKTMYQSIDKHILYTSSDKMLNYTNNKVQYSTASMDKEPVHTSEEKTDLYETLDKLDLYNCVKCNKSFRKLKQCEVHIKEAHSNTKLEDMGEFSEPEDLMDGIHVSVDVDVDHADRDHGDHDHDQDPEYEPALLPHLTVENGQVHQDHVRHWYMRGADDAYCGVCPAPPPPPTTNPTTSSHITHPTHTSHHPTHTTHHPTHTTHHPTQTTHHPTHTTHHPTHTTHHPTQTTHHPTQTTHHPTITTHHPTHTSHAIHTSQTTHMSHTTHTSHTTQSALNPPRENSHASPPLKILKEEVIQRILESDVSSDQMMDNMMENEEISEPTDPPVPQKTEKKKKRACPHCGKEFEHRSSLFYHVICHGGKQHVCRECGKGFYTPGALKIHRRVHNGDRPCKCDVCGRDFRQWSDLAYHKAIHSTQKRFKCEFCGKEFARKYSLNVHRRIHTGERNYKCDYCAMTFRASSYRLIHMRRHTGDKPYKCEECGKCFRVGFDLRRHILTHEKARNGYEVKPKVKEEKPAVEVKTEKNTKEPTTSKVKKIAVASTTKMPTILKVDKKQKPAKKTAKKGAPNVTVSQNNGQFKINSEFTNNVEVYDTRQEGSKFKEVFSNTSQFSKEATFKNPPANYKEENDRDFTTLKPIFRNNVLEATEKPVYIRQENTDGKMQIFTQVEKNKELIGPVLQNTQILGDNRHLEREIVREVRSEVADGIEHGFLERLAALYNIPAV